MQILQRKSSLLLLIIGAAAFYLPSSIGGSILPIAYSIYSVIFCGLLLWSGRNEVIKENIVPAITILLLLGLFTAVSDMPNITFGAIFPYLSICTIFTFCRCAGELGSPKLISALLFGPLLVLGWGTILSFEPATDLVNDFYQAYRDDLLEQMSWMAKPVAVFATHSVAAFVYFAISVLFFRMAALSKKSADKWFGYVMFVGFVAMMPLLLSNSALLLFAMLVSGVGIFWLRKLNWTVAVLLSFVLICFVLFLATTGYFDQFEFMSEVVNVFQSKDNGLMGRFSSGSRLQGTYDYLLDNYFQPIGITWDGVLEIGDNFIAEYILRISIVGYFLVLIMLWNFIKAARLRGWSALCIFLFFVMTDFGFPLLVTFRVVFFLPLYILLWNSIEAGSGLRKAPC